MRHSFITVCTLITLAPVAACAASDVPNPIAQADLHVERVTLYTSGVGYFERGGMVDGDAAETLLFPVDEVNDVLKSLVMLDSGGGTVQPVTYAAQDPLEKQLQAFSINVCDNPDRATLLNRLRGAQVMVSYAEGGVAKSVTGTIMGVETQTVTLPAEAGTTQQTTLNLLADDGMHALPLASISTFQLTDPKLNTELRAALAAVAQNRDASKRPVKLNFTGHGKRSVLVGYLTQAPLWQTTYRLVLGPKPVLQGWALVQNTSQDDWNDISLSLVSGQPISFIQDLYTPLYVDRPVVQAQVTAAPRPQSYTSFSNAAPASNVADGPMERSQAKVGSGRNAIESVNGYYLSPESRATPMDPAEASRQSIAATGAKLGTALFSYKIDSLITVPRQQSAMIPFLSTSVQVGPVSIYNSEVSRSHPLTGARLKNTSALHLMGGPLTVFDQSSSGSGYVGDALMNDTEPGQTRLISYAVDLAVDAEAKPGPYNGESDTIKISEGYLIATRKDQESTIYTFKNHGDKARTVVVEHPYHGESWKLLEPKAVTEHTPKVDRFDLQVPAGATNSLTIREEYPVASSYRLIDDSLDTLLSYTTQGEASEAVKAALKDVIERRQKVARIQKQIDSDQSAIKAISDGQERIRDNMKALDHNSALYIRYVGELNAQETKLELLKATVDSLVQDRDSAQAELAAAVKHMTIE